MSDLLNPSESAASDTSFLPDDYLRKKAQRRLAVVAAGVLLVATGSISAAFLVATRSLADTETRHADVLARYAEEARRIADVQSMQAKQRDLVRRAEFTASLVEPVPRSFLLAKVTNALPPGASLLDLTLDAKVRKPPPKPADTTAYAKRKGKAAEAAAEAAEPEALAYDVAVKLVGIADSDEQVSDFLANLKSVDLFVHSGGTKTDEHVINGRTLRKFEVEIALAPDARAEPDVHDRDAARTATTNKSGGVS